MYEDDDIIVVNKPSGILTIATNKEKELTIYHLVMQYLKSKNKNNKVFIIHRLDKDTSGILMFAKNEKIKNMFQKDWNNIVIERKYYAIVEGKMKNDKGTYHHHIWHNILALPQQGSRSPPPWIALWRGDDWYLPHSILHRVPQGASGRLRDGHGS